MTELARTAALIALFPLRYYDYLTCPAGDSGSHARVEPVVCSVDGHPADASPPLAAGVTSAGL